ncbi:MAG: hypothetical protein M3Y71_11405 [Actinomycetota bacterium]|nr:hypothetical protein [Actinomycetota bacterium]
MADWHAEQRVKESLRTGAPMSAADRRVAQGIVDHVDRQRWVWSAWVVVGLALVVAGLLLGREWWLALPGLVLVVVGGVWWLLVTHRPLTQGARIGIVPIRVRHQGRRVPARAPTHHEG